MKDEQEIPEENKEINDNIENKEVINGNLSSYSKLSSNDHGLNLINEAFELHNNKKDYQNRIKLFKTRLLSTKDSQQKSQNLPDIFNFDEEDNSKSEQKPEKIKVEPNNINNLNDIFFVLLVSFTSKSLFTLFSLFFKIDIINISIFFLSLILNLNNEDFYRNINKKIFIIR